MLLSWWSFPVLKPSFIRNRSWWRSICREAFQVVLICLYPPCSAAVAPTHVINGAVTALQLTQGKALWAPALTPVDAGVNFPCVVWWLQADDHVRVVCSDCVCAVADVLIDICVPCFSCGLVLVSCSNSSLHFAVEQDFIFYGKLKQVPCANLVIP